LQRLTLAKREWLLLLAATCVVYFYGLGRSPLVGSDEPRYAQVAREMLMRGDMVTPTLGGHTWFEKPALLYWMEMASYRVFGVSEWSARLGPVCSGLLTILLLGWLGRRIERAAGEEERDISLACATVASSSAGLIVFSRVVNFDVIITMTMTWALACFFVSELEVNERRRRFWLAGFYAGCGLSLLAKGLIGVVLPFGIVALYFLVRRDFAGAKRLGLWWGSILTLAVAAIWYGPVIARHGWTFIDQFIIQHHFERYVSNKYHHPQPFWFYVPVMALLILPWTTFLIAALGGAPHWNWRGEDTVSKLRVFGLAWLVVPVAFFSLSGSKLPGYVLPAVPGAALLISEQLAMFLRGESSGKAIRATGVLLLIMASAWLVYDARMALTDFKCALIISLPPALGGVFVLLWARLRRLSAALIVCATFGMVILITGCALESVMDHQSVRGLMQLAEARGYASAPVYNMHTVERTAEFYAAGRLAYQPDGEPVKFEGASQVVDEARQRSGWLLIIIPKIYVEQLTENGLLQTDVIGDNGELTLVAVRARGLEPHSYSLGTSVDGSGDRLLMPRATFHEPSAWRFKIVIPFPLSLMGGPPATGVSSSASVPHENAQSPTTWISSIEGVCSTLPN